ncbi:MAG: hypothetical protein FJ033_06645 [Chloroflexi bacterium]|nr:hypothetical protein [Chloroflexota bacterium]
MERRRGAIILTEDDIGAHVLRGVAGATGFVSRVVRMREIGAVPAEDVALIIIGRDAPGAAALALIDTLATRCARDPFPLVRMCDEPPFGRINAREWRLPASAPLADLVQAVLGVTRGETQAPMTAPPTAWLDGARRVLGWAGIAASIALVA